MLTLEESQEFSEIATRVVDVQNQLADISGHLLELVQKLYTLQRKLNEC